MSNVKVVSPSEARALMDEGYRYLDVRSELEFEAGHPSGAFNVPLMHPGAGGLEPNENFLAVVQANFEIQLPLVVGCKSGGRSRRAIEALETVGYQTLADLTAGWDGKRDAVGRQQPGWSRSGLPVESGLPEGRRYTDLLKRTQG